MKILILVLSIGFSFSTFATEKPKSPKEKFSLNKYSEADKRNMQGKPQGVTEGSASSVGCDENFCPAYTSGVQIKPNWSVLEAEKIIRTELPPSEKEVTPATR